MENSQVHPLQRSQVHTVRGILNIIYTLLHVLAIPAIIYYRAAFFFNESYYYSYYMVPLLPWLIICVAELVVLFLWLLKQPICWRPITRTAFPENLPSDEELPRIDVFVCTTDPNKEPTFEVMNTVISAMCLDYPADKLSVHLSDDGGSSVTLYGMKEAWVFATWWLPFCKKYNIKPICPYAYFDNLQEISQSNEFIEDRKIVEEKYEIFNQRVHNWKGRRANDAKTSFRDHPATVQVINENFVEDDVATMNPETTDMPLLVYVAREKKPSHPHHFKAGALNVLQRVSSILSNAPYILTLDCDMYCNDSLSARQAMCFHLDPKISSSLGWVQFPQKFHNVSENDVYGSEMKTLWHVMYPGLDGAQGIILAGTNLYIKRKALYSLNIDNNVDDVKEQRNTFGSGNEFIKSLSQIDKPNRMNQREISSECLREAHFLASCAYEEGTQWGKKVGYRYDTVVEDVMTGFALLGQGWKSIFLNPKRPQFLGSATTNLNEALIQISRWSVGLLQFGLSKHFPLLNNSPRVLIHQKMLYSWAALFSLDFLPASCFAIVPPICFFYGIPLYPKVSDPFFIPFAFVFISSRMKHLWEVLMSGGSIHLWLHEQRFAMIKAVTCYVYAMLELVMAMLGIRQSSFIPTNKAADDDTSKWYRMGKYDFRTSNKFLVPIVGAVTLNLSSFVVGTARVIVSQSWETLFAQLFFSLFVLIITFPVIEGMLLRKDNARVPLRTTLISTLMSWIILSLGYFIL